MVLSKKVTQLKQKDKKKKLEDKTPPKNKELDLKTICINYSEATKTALEYMQSKGKGKWKVMRSHESPYNIEGDDKLKDKLIKLFTTYGVHVGLVSHFHVGAVMVKHDVSKVDAGALERGKLLFGQTTYMYKDAAYDSKTKTMNIKDLNLFDEKENVGDFVQIVVGHSGRFLDPLSKDLPTNAAKVTDAIVYWARGRDWSKWKEPVTLDKDKKPTQQPNETKDLPNEPFLSNDRFGFAHVTFKKDSIVANFYDNVGTDLTPEITINITAKTSKRRRNLLKKN